jgi:hypothetical protein
MTIAIGNYINLSVLSKNNNDTVLQDVFNVFFFYNQFT